MDKFINDFIEKSNRQKALVLSTNYIEWLCEFTKARRKFTSTQWDYLPLWLFAEDRENVDLLTVFFEEINKYCQKNLIPYKGNTSDYCYTIKYKDTVLNVGVCIGQGAFNYVERKDVVDENAIDFIDIINNAKHKQFDETMKKLNEFEKALDEIKKIGFSKEQVILMINNKQW